MSHPPLIKPMSEKPQVGVCIPVYYSGPEVPRVLDELLTSIEAQDYPKHRLHMMLSVQKCDLAQHGELATVMFNGRHVNAIFPQGDVDSPAKNTNLAMATASGVDYIKLMNQDDFLDSPTAISEMVDALENSDAKWLVSTCVHTDGEGKKRERIHIPSWPGEKGMVEGINRFGCPSVAMFDASLSLQCDPKIEYAMDCAMWIDLVRLAGMPLIHRKPDVVIRMWDAQLTNQFNTAAALERDKAYMRQKYGYI